MSPMVHDDLKDFQPYVIVERDLDAKYYQYAPEELCDMCDYNCNAMYLAEGSCEYSTWSASKGDFVHACSAQCP